MSPPATTPAAGERTAGGGGWLGTVALVGYVAVVLWIAIGRPPLRVSLLHTAMRVCQRVAGWIGAAGLHTEAAYRREIDMHRGGA